MTNNVIHLDKTSTRRWHVEISYRSGWGPPDAFDIEEITDLHMIRKLDRIVEGGQDWRAIDKIIITLNSR